VASENVIGHRLSRHPLVSMMKSSHLRERDDAPKISRLDTPRFGSILRKDGMVVRARL